MTPDTLRSWLKRLPRSRQLDYVRSYRGPHGRAICHLLTEAAWQARMQPGASIWESRLAMTLAEHGGFVAELWRALMVYGNALRIHGRFAAAALAFGRASELPFNLSQEDRIFDLSLRASLLREMGDFEGACDLIDNALDLQQRARRFGAVARLLIQKAVVEAEYDQLAALRSINRALKLADPSADLTLVLLAHHNAAELFTVVGRAQVAQRILQAIEPLYAQVEDVGLHAGRWIVAAHAARQLGLASVAEDAYRQAIAAFESREQVQGLAFALLELAQLLVETGRQADAVAMVRRAVQVTPFRRDQKALEKILRDGLSSAALSAGTTRLKLTRAS